MPAMAPAATSTNSRFALVGAQVFDGDAFRDDAAVVVEGSRIAAVLPRRALAGGIPVEAVAGTLASGFIDVQVNGGGGVLFNTTPTVEGIAAIGRAHRPFGTIAFLPTFITDTRERTAEATAAVRSAIDFGIPGVLGIHLEGPFLNPARAGAHDGGRVAAWRDDDVGLLTSLGRGVTLVTLAPEMVPAAAIAQLTAAGVIVAAGHTAASVETIAAARKAGLTGFTHLFNAMPAMTAREPGPVGAALIDRDAWASVIADLHHVSPTTLCAMLAARGLERTLLVTDAMPTVGTDLAEFSLQGRPIRRRDGQLLTEEGRLAGSDLDMAAAVRNMVGSVGVPLPAALRMASLAPAAFLGIDHEYGRIAPGYRASLVLLDDALNVRRAWVDGEEAPRERN
jgi:N-acetylglucosamine-6-phosphate deacetylase